MVKAIVFEVWDVFFNQPEELRMKLWNSLGVKNSREIDMKMFHSNWTESYHKGNITEEAYWNGLIDLLPFEYEGSWTSLCRLFERTVWLNSDVVAICQYLKKKFDLYVVSNAGPELKRRLDHFELTPLFKKVMSSAELGAVKPEGQIFDLMIEEIGLPADEILFVDPVYENIIEARKWETYPYLYTNAQAFQQFFVYSHLASKSGSTTISSSGMKGWKPFAIQGGKESTSGNEM